MATKPTDDKKEKAAKSAKPPRQSAEKVEGSTVASAPTPAAAPAPESPASGADASHSVKTRKRPGVGPRRGKKLRNLLKGQQQKLGKEGVVPVKKAIALLRSMKRSKMDETVEVHLSLGIDTTHSDQMVRGSVNLPHGTGKTVRVLVFCQGENIAKAKEAGADFAGADELVKKIQSENWLDFDKVLATQDMMGVVARLGKVLGPRGLMPTPKAGTVIPLTGDLGAAVRESKAGKIEFRADKGGNVHAGVGKMSFDDEKIAANVQALVDQVRAIKPAGVKGNYIRGLHVVGDNESRSTRSSVTARVA